MSPIVLLAGAGLALLVLASSKGGKADSSTCLPGAVKQMFASLSKTEFQALAAMARQQGNEEVASCYDKLAAGEPCPLAASGTEAFLRGSTPEILKGLAVGLRKRGESEAADCLDALAKEKST